MKARVGLACLRWIRALYWRSLQSPDKRPRSRHPRIRRRTMPKPSPSSRWPQALDESKSQIDLFDSSKERKTYENLADLYTIITATEHLERAYAQDAITQSEYTAECNKLISQFKIAEKAALGSDGMTTEDFIKIYQMDCPRAADRLLRMGVPEPVKRSDGSGNVAITVAETG